MKKGIVICLHEYDYSFKGRDKLAKRFSNFEIWKVILSGILPIIYQISNQNGIAAYSLVNAGIKMVLYYKNRTYYDNMISTLYS